MVGGWVRGKKKTVVYLKSASNFRQISFFLSFFSPEETFSDVGGWVGWGSPPPPGLSAVGCCRPIRNRPSVAAPTPL